MNYRAKKVDEVANFVRSMKKYWRDRIEQNGLKILWPRLRFSSRLHISGFMRIRPCVVLELGTHDIPKNGNNGVGSEWKGKLSNG